MRLSKSSDVVRVRIQQMEPDIMDVGSDLARTVQLQTIHEELIHKLKVSEGESCHRRCRFHTWNMETI